jgi:hypothetical protein
MGRREFADKVTHSSISSTIEEKNNVKGIFQPFELGDETGLIRSDVKK